MPNPIINRRVVLKRNTSAPIALPYGDIFTETFAPTAGTYTLTGTAATTVTSGNMAISGGNGFFSNQVVLDDIVWNGNNWYFESEYIMNGVTIGEFSSCFGFVSVSGVQLQNLYFGLYYATTTNNFQLDIFKSDPAFGQIISSDSVGQYLNVVSGQRVRLRADFTESTIVVTAYNLDPSNLNSVSVTYTWGYTLAATEIKPNLGKLMVSAPVTAIDLKSYKFGSQYLNGVDRLFRGDSITSGYFGGAEADRYQNQYATATGKTIATFAGAGDRALETNQSAVLNHSTIFNPVKSHILLGTNDKASGQSDAAIISNISGIIAADQASGASVYVGTLLPRNGQNNLSINALISALTGVTIIDYYTNMEFPVASGNINPLYSDDLIHPNLAGETFMKNLLIASGF